MNSCHAPPIRCRRCISIPRSEIYSASALRTSRSKTIARTHTSRRTSPCDARANRVPEILFLRAAGSIDEHAVVHGYDFAGIFVDEDGIGSVAHPGIAVWRREQPVDTEIPDPERAGEVQSWQGLAGRTTGIGGG